MILRRELLNTLSVEQRLLLALCRTKLSEDVRANALQLLRSESIDWGMFFALAADHGVLLTTYRRIQQIAPEKLPPQIKASVQDVVFRSTTHNLEVTNELVRISELFIAERLPMLTYKGPTLAQVVYGGIALRHFSDVDMLVRGQDLLRAKRLIIERGYQAVSSAEHRKFQKEDADRSYQGYDLLRNDGQVVIDLQERSGLRYSSFSLSFDELWARRKSVRFGDISVAYPSMEDYLWLLCAHGTQHRWQKLKWICDIAQLIQVVPDLAWNQLLDRAQALQTERLVAIGILTAALCLDMPIPEAVRARIESDKDALYMSERVVEWLFRETTGLSGALSRAAFEYPFDMSVRPRLRDKMSCVIFLTRRRLRRHLR